MMPHLCWLEIDMLKNLVIVDGVAFKSKPRAVDFVAALLALGGEGTSEDTHRKLFGALRGWCAKEMRDQVRVVRPYLAQAGVGIAAVKVNGRPGFRIERASPDASTLSLRVKYARREEASA